MSQVGSPTIPRPHFDAVPLLLFPIIMLLLWPLVSPSTWLTLTVAGLAMGMILFLVTSGLTLVFGLMDVLNFGHGVFISLGAYAGYVAMRPLSAWVASPTLGLNLAVVGIGVLAGMVVAGIAGFLFERIIIRPAYGSHLKQMLVTMGGLIVVQEIIRGIWGGEATAVGMPERLRGAFLVGDVAIEKYRIFAMIAGTLILAAMLWTFNRTKIGILIRAGVQNREMVQSLGYRVDRLFVGVFTAGSMLAGIGGVMWALYQQSVRPEMGGDLTVLIFTVIIIGGLGSTFGCFIAALLVGLTTNYTGFISPTFGPFSNLVLLVAILFWRPGGIYPVANR